MGFELQTVRENIERGFEKCLNQSTFNKICGNNHMKSLTSPLNYNIWDNLKWAHIRLKGKGVRKQRNKSAWESCTEKNFERGIGKWKWLEAEFRSPLIFWENVLFKKPKPRVLMKNKKHDWLRLKSSHEPLTFQKYEAGFKDYIATNSHFRYGQGES